MRLLFLALVLLAGSPLSALLACVSSACDETASCTPYANDDDGGLDAERNAQGGKFLHPPADENHLSAQSEQPSNGSNDEVNHPSSPFYIHRHNTNVVGDAHEPSFSKGPMVGMLRCKLDVLFGGTRIRLLGSIIYATPM